MIINNCEIAILIKNRPLTEFLHEGQTFIEGRGGSKYEISFRNHNSFRVEVILAVDGLSITDGKMAGPQSSGYVVEAYGSLTVPGWTLDNNAVAAFTFAEQKGGSYVEQSTGSDVNKGVIGALVYKEKPSVVFMKSNVWTSYNTNTTWPYNGYPNSNLNGDILRQYNGVEHATNTMNVSLSSATSPYQETSMRAAASVYVSQTEQPEVEQTLGTAFGKKTDFNTRTVSFARGDILCTIELYYDDAAGLRKRGIVFKKKVKPTPQAFPGLNVGCKPPPNWKG